MRPSLVTALCNAGKVPEDNTTAWPKAAHDIVDCALLAAPPNIDRALAIYLLLYLSHLRVLLRKTCHMFLVLIVDTIFRRVVLIVSTTIICYRIIR